MPSVALRERGMAAGRSRLRHCSCSGVKIKINFLASTTAPRVFTARVVFKDHVVNSAGLKGVKIGINQISWLQVS